MSSKGGKSLIPQRLRERLPEPERPRERKVTARFTEDEFQLLERLSGERDEKLSAFVRSLVVAALEEVREKLQE